MIEIEHLFKFYDRRPVLNDISLSVREGSILGLLGPNGAGKTTLVSILAGIVRKDRGRVLVNGGEMYGETEGRFIRLNIACPRKLLLEGLERIIRTLCGRISGTRTCPASPAGS